MSQNLAPFYLAFASTERSRFLWHPVVIDQVVDPDLRKILVSHGRFSRLIFKSQYAKQNSLY